MRTRNEMAGEYALHSVLPQVGGAEQGKSVFAAQLKNEPTMGENGV